MEWLRQHMAHDPREAVGRVEQPVLIIHGEDDVKVLPYHALALAEALREAGNDNVEVHMLPKTTHYFTLFPIDNPAYDATNPWKLEPSLFELIGNWPHCARLTICNFACLRNSLGVTPVSFLNTRA